MATPKDLQIGCIALPIEIWLKNYSKIGEKHGYTPEEIEEYKAYIELAAKLYL
jgi:hypothetical protein